jgi:hypothetical protein
MADIKLGLTRSAIEGAKDTYDGPRTPFPANKVGYTKYTGIVTDLQIKEGTGRTEGKAWLWIQLTNGVHQESLLVNLDPSDIAPNTAPDKVEKAVQRNLDTLLRAVKVLDIANAAGDGIDTNKFAAAVGTLVSFGVKLGEMQDNGYPKYFTSFYGKADALVPVDAPVGGVTSSKDDEDIPF